MLSILPIACRGESVPLIQIGVDYHYNLGLTQKLMGESIHKKDFNMYGNSLHITLLYNLSTKYTIGIGTGFDAYRPSANTLPLFATFRYHPLQQEKLKHLYCFTNLGYSIPVDDDDLLSSGWMFDIGVGWQKMFYRHFGINLQLGYNLKEFKANRHYYDKPTEEYLTNKFNILRNSLALGFGVVF